MQVFSPLSIKLNILNNIEGSGVVTYFVHLKERKKGSSMALGSTNNYIIKKNPESNQQRPSDHKFRISVSSYANI